MGYSVQNASEKPLEVSTFGQLKQTAALPTSRDTQTGGLSTMHTFRGAAFSTADSKYEKYKFDTILDNENLNVSTKTVGLPCCSSTSPPHGCRGITGRITSTPPTSATALSLLATNRSRYWCSRARPTNCRARCGSARLFRTKWLPLRRTDLTVDYGWLWFISQPLFKLLKFIHSFLGNWGFSIIVITFIVRGIMYPLTKAQYTSMAKMRMLQPKIQAMRERLGDDKQRQSREMMALYKAEK